jgi:nucleoside-diphosphate-sugar epimerase
LIPSFHSYISPHDGREEVGDRRERVPRLRNAMCGCGDVFYCVVDRRAWLRDPAPLFPTDVEGRRHVLDAAVDADPRRFAFTSTIGIPAGPPSSFRRIDSAAKTSSGLRMPSSDIGFKINVWPKNSR